MPYEEPAPNAVVPVPSSLHALLNASSVVAGSSATLAKHWDSLDEAGKRELVRMLQLQANALADALTHLARWTPPTLRTEIDLILGLDPPDASGS